MFLHLTLSNYVDDIQICCWMFVFCTHVCPVSDEIYGDFEGELWTGLWKLNRFEAFGLFCGFWTVLWILNRLVDFEPSCGFWTVLWLLDRFVDFEPFYGFWTSNPGSRQTSDSSQSHLNHQPNQFPKPVASSCPTNKHNGHLNFSYRDRKHIQELTNHTLLIWRLIKSCRFILKARAQ
jgi:hypothetical protein